MAEMDCYFEFLAFMILSVSQNSNDNDGDGAQL